MTSDQQAELRREIATLREDADDLRASAEWWRKLYEKAIRRRTERDAAAANKKARDGLGRRFSAFRARMRSVREDKG